MKKIILGLLVAVLPVLSQAFTQQECQALAEQAFYAQALLNDNPVAFAEITAQIVARIPDSETPALDKALVDIAGKLHQGDNPEPVASALYVGCTKNLI